jgi:hypothetical protein
MPSKIHSIVEILILPISFLVFPGIYFPKDFMAKFLNIRVSLRKKNDSFHGDKDLRGKVKKLSALLFFQFIYTKVGFEQVRHFST